MARIPLTTPETMNPAQRKVYDEVVSGPRGQWVGPLRAAIHNPTLAEAWQRFGAVLRFNTSLPARLTELAILVTARRWNSQVEWQIHAQAAARAGLRDSVIEDLRHGRAPALEQHDEIEVYEFARDLQMRGVVGEPAYAAVRARWGAIGVVELTALIGYYTMVSMTLNAHEIPAVEGLPIPFETAATGLTEIPPPKVPGGRAS